MWVLALNSIYGRAEHREFLMRAETLPELVEFVNKEKAPEPYEVIEENNRNYVYTKTFKKGSVLENFNPPASDVDPSCYVFVRTLEEHLKEAEEHVRKQWDVNVMSLPIVSVSKGETDGSASRPDEQSQQNDGEARPV